METDPKLHRSEEVHGMLQKHGFYLLQGYINLAVKFKHKGEHWHAMYAPSGTVKEEEMQGHD